MGPGGLRVLGSEVTGQGLWGQGVAALPGLRGEGGVASLCGRGLEVGLQSRGHCYVGVASAVWGGVASLCGRGLGWDFKTGPVAMGAWPQRVWAWPGGEGRGPWMGLQNGAHCDWAWPQGEGAWPRGRGRGLEVWGRPNEGGGGRGGSAGSPETALCELGTPKPPREAPPLPPIAPPPLPVSPLPHFASVYPLPPSPPSRYHLRSALLCAALPALPAAGSSPRLRFRPAPFPAFVTSASAFPAHILLRP